MPLFNLENFIVNKDKKGASKEIKLYENQLSHIESLTLAASRVSEEFYLNFVTMTKDNFVSIFSAARRWHTFVLYSCTFQGESKFQLDPKLEYNYKDISLHQWWGKEDGKLSPKDLEKLIKAMARTNMKDSLTTIRVENGLHWLSKLKQIIKSEMPNVKVVITKANTAKWKFR